MATISGKSNSDIIGRVFLKSLKSLKKNHGFESLLNIFFNIRVACIFFLNYYAKRLKRKNINYLKNQTPTQPLTIITNKLNAPWMMKTWNRMIR